MSILNNDVWSKACEIFEVDLDSSLLDSTYEEEDEEMDLDETYCEEAEEILFQEKSNHHETSNAIYLLKSFSTHEKTAVVRNIHSASSEKLVPGDIRNEYEAFEDLWAAMSRCNKKPTMDGFLSCFKKFKRSTLVRLNSTLEEHLKATEKASKKRQEAKLWYKNFKLTDEEREDSLCRLRVIAEEYLKPDAGKSTKD